MKMEFPLTYGLRKTGLPLILTSGKLKNVCFLIDTGSTHNSIFSFVYDHFKDEFQIQEEMQKTMGIEGNYQECQTVEATFNFEGTDYTSTFMIMDATSAMAAPSRIGIRNLMLSFNSLNRWVRQWISLS